MITPIITTIIAFLIGGVVVAATGHNPISTYKGIFEGTGLNWFFPWVTGDERVAAEFNLQQTLLVTTPLILTGLAVAFAFRCGMFNIGGQGQYTMGAITSVWVGSVWAGLPGRAARDHRDRARDARRRALGRDRRHPEGDGRGPRGDHDDHAQLDRVLDRDRTRSASAARCRTTRTSRSRSRTTSSRAAQAPGVWGNPVLQGLHIGFFIAIGALFVYWLVLNRTTLGYEVRAVGYNPEAARYGGINVARNNFLAMAIAGAFAGLDGAADILGWQFRLGRSTSRSR